MLVVVKIRLQAIKLNRNRFYHTRPVLTKAYCTVSTNWDSRRPPLSMFLLVAVLWRKPAYWPRSLTGLKNSRAFVRNWAQWSSNPSRCSWESWS